LRQDGLGRILRKILTAVFGMSITPDHESLDPESVDQTETDCATSDGAQLDHVTVKHVTLDQVKQVAFLARLEVSADEAERLAAEMNRVLDYVEKLNALDTDGIEPTAHVVPVLNAFRPDTVVPFDNIEGLLAAAPRRQERYYKVPPIID
jgi:aspartyl-tRNA(Asn)/glutamyl-tRNA(Gln) amidotransferase subunit C